MGLFGGGWWNDKVEVAIRRQVDAALERMALDIDSKYSWVHEREELKKQVEDLKIEKLRRTEEFEKREREIEHKIGLERKRQEFEADTAKREVEIARKEAEVKVREENLQKDIDRFESQMTFQHERFEKEAVSLREMVKELVEKLPDSSIIAKIGHVERVVDKKER